MSRIRIAAGVGLGLVLAAATLSCGDITEPEPAVEVRVAHAAPGLGIATVLMDSVPEFQLAPNQTGFFPIRQRPVLYQFAAGQDTAALTVSHQADITALVLMNTDDPTLHQYELEHMPDHIRIRVINGDFPTGETMEVRIEAADTTFEGAVAPGEDFLIEPTPGSFQLQVRGGGSEVFVDVEPFALIQHDHGFMVILPDPAAPAGSAWSRLIF